MAAEGKKTRGRQRILLQRIENEDDRMITFSKRRSGIYKKANELVTLCGADVAILIFSQAGKAYNFGSPSIGAIADRFLNGTVLDPTTNPPEGSRRRFEEIHRSAKINDLNQRHNEIIEQVNALKARQDELRKKMMTGKKEQQDWWEIPVKEMNQDQLLVTQFLLGKVSTTLNEKIKEKNFGSSSTASGPNNPDSAIGGI